MAHPRRWVPEVVVTGEGRPRLLGGGAERWRASGVLKGPVTPCVAEQKPWHRAVREHGASSSTHGLPSAALQKAGLRPGPVPGTTRLITAADQAAGEGTVTGPGEASPAPPPRRRSTPGRTPHRATGRRHGPVTTIRLLALAPALHRTVIPPATTEPPARPAPAHPVALVAASFLQPFVRLAGPWRLIWAKATGRRLGFGKTER